MKKSVALLFISFIAQFYCAAESDTTQFISVDVDSAAVFSFYEAQGISIDSCTNKQLYFEVYNWIGTPYCYAGESKKGIDCSGFSSKIYESIFEKNLSGGSRDIYKTTTPVDLESAQEGDLIFFKIRKGQISHVGIYLKDGKFAHATTRSGVIISDLSETYYKKYFYKIGKLTTQGEL